VFSRHCSQDKKKMHGLNWKSQQMTGPVILGAEETGAGKEKKEMELKLVVNQRKASLLFVFA
jgi:hypothetical protein